MQAEQLLITHGEIVDRIMSILNLGLQCRTGQRGNARRI